MIVHIITSVVIAIVWVVVIAMIANSLLTVCDKLSDYLSTLADRTEAEKYLIMSDPRYDHSLEEGFERADDLKEKELEALQNQNDALEALISRLDTVIDHIHETKDTPQSTDSQADGYKQVITNAIPTVPTSEDESRCTGTSS